MAIPVSTESLYINMNDVSNIITKLAISSQFKVSLNLNRGGSDGDLHRHLTRCGIFDNLGASYESYDLLCSQASLPSSTNFILEERGSRQGVIEKFATYRVYDNFSLTFYIDDQYNIIRLFEEWMNFINPIHDSTGKYEGDRESQYGKYRDRSSYYRLRYPDSYKRDISVTKFERNLVVNPNDKNKKFNNLPLLNYRFHDCFPVDIQTVPLTYDNSIYTQLTIGWSYSRHTIEKFTSKHYPTIF